MNKTNYWYHIQTVLTQGWNSQSKYKKIELDIDNVDKLDHGLNSPLELFNTKNKIIGEFTDKLEEYLS